MMRRVLGVWGLIVLGGLDLTWIHVGLVPRALVSAVTPVTPTDADAAAPFKPGSIGSVGSVTPVPTTLEILPVADAPADVPVVDALASVPGRDRDPLPVAEAPVASANRPWVSSDVVVRFRRTG